MEDLWLVQLWLVWQALTAISLSQQLHYCNQWWSIKMASQLYSQYRFVLSYQHKREWSICWCWGNRSSAVLFNSSTPDIAVIKDNILYAICYRTNSMFWNKFSKSRNYKINRYKNLSNKVVGNHALKKLLLDISSLGFYTNYTTPFIKFFRELKIDNTERMLRKCRELAIRASCYLNIGKNKEWHSPKLLTFA